MVKFFCDVCGQEYSEIRDEKLNDAVADYYSDYPAKSACPTVREVCPACSRRGARLDVEKLILAAWRENSASETMPREDGPQETGGGDIGAEKSLAEAPEQPYIDPVAAAAMDIGKRVLASVPAAMVQGPPRGEVVFEHDVCSESAAAPEPPVGGSLSDGSAEISEAEPNMPETHQKSEAASEASERPVEGVAVQEVSEPQEDAKTPPAGENGGQSEVSEISSESKPVIRSKTVLIRGTAGGSSKNEKSATSPKRGPGSHWAEKRETLDRLKAFRASHAGGTARIAEAAGLSYETVHSMINAMPRPIEEWRKVKMALDKLEIDVDAPHV